MIRQYLSKYNPKTKSWQYYGVLIAEKDESNQVKIGWSALHPKDSEEIEKYNQNVKRVNAESWRLLNQGNPEAAKIEGYKPKFDKKEAVKIARDKMSPVVRMGGLRPNIQRAMKSFVFDRVIPYFQDGQVTVQN